MRLCLALLASTTLTACGGAGLGSAGSSAPPAATGTTATVAASTHSFVNPTEVKTYSGIGGVHKYTYTTSDAAGTGPQDGQLYAGDATTARNSGISITYNPRDAIFDLKINQSLAGVGDTVRFQDPLHRTNFGGATEPQPGVPNLAAQGVNYLEAGTVSQTGAPGPITYSGASPLPAGPAGLSSDISTFFYQKPGTSTKYVTFAGFVRNSLSVTQVTPTAGAPYLKNSYSLERGVFTFGERSASNVIPKTGTGTYTGAMLGTMVFNPLLDTDRTAPTYFQWLTGTSTTKLDFAANSFTLDLAGTTSIPLFDVATVGDAGVVLHGNDAFIANATGRVDVATTGGFVGQFQTAYFTRPDGTRFNVTIGGSSVDGAFFGPAAQEVGGGFRIVGGVPDERIDILGVFTGKQ